MPPCFVSTGLCHVSNIPLVGSISVKLHGKWDNLTFSRVSSRLAVWRFCFKDCHSLHDFGETALIDGQTAYCWIAGSLFGIILMILYVYVCRKENQEAQKHKDQSTK